MALFFAAMPLTEPSSNVLKVVGGALYRAMAAAGAQVAADAPRCAWPARPARAGRERFPLA